MNFVKVLPYQQTTDDCELASVAEKIAHLRMDFLAAKSSLLELIKPTAHRIRKAVLVSTAEKTGRIIRAILTPSAIQVTPQ